MDVLASFPGLPRFQFWILKAIKNWSQVRPGNEAMDVLLNITQRTNVGITRMMGGSCLWILFIVLTHWLTDSTELNTSAPHKTALEHFAMNTNDAYGTNTAEIATTGNVAYMTAGDTIPATQNVAYGQVPPETDDCYDYVI